MITKMISFSKSGGCAATRTAAGRQEYLERDDRAIYIETNNIFDEKNWGQEIDRSRDDYGDRGTITGREYIMSPPDHDYCTPEQMLDIARDWVDDRHPDVESVIAVHDDNGHVHCHIYMGAYNLQTERKEHFSHEDIRADHNRAQDIAREYGLSRGPDYERGRDFRNETDRHYSRAVEEMRARGDATPLRDAADQRAQERALEQQRAQVQERAQEQARSHEKERAQEPERKDPEPERAPEPQRDYKPQRQEPTIERVLEPERKEPEPQREPEPEHAPVFDSYEDDVDERAPEREDSRVDSLVRNIETADQLNRDFADAVNEELRLRDALKPLQMRVDMTQRSQTRAEQAIQTRDELHLQIAASRDRLNSLVEKHKELEKHPILNRKELDQSQREVTRENAHLQDLRGNLHEGPTRAQLEDKVRETTQEHSAAREELAEARDTHEIAEERMCETAMDARDAREYCTEQYRELPEPERDEVWRQVDEPSHTLDYAEAVVDDRNILRDQERDYERDYD